MRLALLALLSFLPLQSCGFLVASGVEVAIPVDQTQRFLDWASALPGYSALNGDPEIIDSVEFDMWATWVLYQAIENYAVTAPTGPQGPATTATVVLPEGG